MQGYSATKKEWQRDLQEELVVNPTLRMSLYSAIYAYKLWEWKNTILKTVYERGDSEKYNDILFKFPCGWGGDTLRILKIAHPRLYKSLPMDTAAQNIIKWIEEVL